MTAPTEIRAVILAGGSGTRLWPLSRLHAPKQFLRVAGDRSLLEATASRLAPMIPNSKVLVITNEETSKGEGFRILESYEKILEPVGRNTAPAVGIATVYLMMGGTDPVMVVLPSDHLIRDVHAFQAALATAIDAAAEGALVIFGIKPTRPETGFGYIRTELGAGPRRVKSFHEKPDLETARAFVESPEYYWNSGMFVWRASSIREEIKRFLPNLDAVLKAIEEDSGEIGFEAAVQRHFSSAPSISIDKGVLEHSNRMLMIPATFDWSDVGSWDAVYEVMAKDARGNALEGDVIAIDCDNIFVRSESRMVAAVNVADVQIIETADAVLVTRRGESQNVRKIVDELARRESPQRELHATVRRPWGSYTVLHEGSNYKMKRIEVRPGGRLSLQRHRHRSEHWVVIAGEATVKVGEAETVLRTNESTFIPIGSIHRLENRHAEPLHIVEVQVGSYVGEDDIERFDDQYGRATLETKAK